VYDERTTGVVEDLDRAMDVPSVVVRIAHDSDNGAFRDISHMLSRSIDGFVVKDNP
jgi:hypothetical protein